MSLNYLKIKRLTLASEARHIRRLEASKARAYHKAKKAEKHNIADLSLAERHALYLHRVNVVRPAARQSHLAYGFLKGVPYSCMENLSFTVPDWDKIEKMAVRFSNEDERVVKQKFEEWKYAALEYIEANKILFDMSDYTHVKEFSEKSSIPYNNVEDSVFSKIASMFTG